MICPPSSVLCRLSSVVCSLPPTSSAALLQPPTTSRCPPTSLRSPTRESLRLGEAVGPTGRRLTSDFFLSSVVCLLSSALRLLSSVFRPLAFSLRVPVSPHLRACPPCEQGEAGGSRAAQARRAGRPSALCPPPYAFYLYYMTKLSFHPRPHFHEGLWLTFSLRHL
jgi:hypothetical protein